MLVELMKITWTIRTASMFVSISIFIKSFCFAYGSYAYAMFMKSFSSDILHFWPSSGQKEKKKK